MSQCWNCHGPADEKTRYLMDDGLCSICSKCVAGAQLSDTGEQAWNRSVTWLRKCAACGQPTMVLAHRWGKSPYGRGLTPGVLIRIQMGMLKTVGWHAPQSSSVAYSEYSCRACGAGFKGANGFAIAQALLLAVLLSVPCLIVLYEGRLPWWQTALFILPPASLVLWSLARGLPWESHPLVRVPRLGESSTDPSTGT